MPLAIRLVGYLFILCVYDCFMATVAVKDIGRFYPLLTVHIPLNLLQQGERGGQRNG